MATLHRLRELGVRISMDDFGTGYSSLSYLRSSRSTRSRSTARFISGLPDDDDSVAIVRAVAGLADNLNMTTTAEGVETAEQLEQVRALGCTEMQGYLFSRPRAAGAAHAAVRAAARGKLAEDAALAQLRRRAENPRVLDHARSGRSCRR